MRIFQERQWFNQWWIIVIYLFLAGFPLFACYKWFILKENLGNVDPTNWGGILTIFILFPLSLALLLLVRLKTTIDDRGITYKYTPVHLNHKTVPWASIQCCYVKKYNALTEFGGWGYKYGRKGLKAMTIKGNKGIYLEMKNGNKLLIGTQKPIEVRQTINQYFHNERI